MKLQLNQIEWKKVITKHIVHNMAVLLCAALTVLFLVLAVVALFSFQKNEGIAVKEAFDVSSAPLDATEQNFVTQLSGYLVNNEDKKADVEKILIVVGNGRDREEIEIDGLTLYPRLAEQIRHEWKTGLAFDRIHSVSVMVDGQRQQLAHSTADWEFDPNVIIYALLCAISCYGTVFIAKKRYYRYQEDQMALRATEE